MNEEGRIAEGQHFHAALGLSAIFAIALTFLTLIISALINIFLLGIIPDHGIGEEAEINLIIESLRPIGYFALGITIVLILVGYALKKRLILTTGSVALYIPIFGTFATSMFFLAGIGIVRLLWLPFFDIPWLFNLGSIVYLPYLALLLLIPISMVFILLIFIVPFFLQGLGFVFLLQSMIAWFYGKFKDIQIVDFWAYRHSRHPQYLGFIIWSYGLLLWTVAAPAPFGAIYFVPSLPWLISTMLIIGVALYEETQMMEQADEQYIAYREKTPFLLQVPIGLSALITAPLRIILKKDWPENGRDVVITVTLYLVILMLLSVPVAFLLSFLFPF